MGVQEVKAHTEQVREEPHEERPLEEVTVEAYLKVEGIRLRKSYNLNGNGTNSCSKGSYASKVIVSLPPLR